MTRPFRILGVQQIAIGGLDRVALRTLWVTLLGARQTREFVSERENVAEDVCTLGEGSRTIEFDLMQPLDPAAKPAVHVPALNHIGLWVDDLRAAVNWLDAQGMRFAPGGIRPGASGHDVCFIHPRPDAEHPLSGEGVLIELVQAPPDLVAQVAHGQQM